MPPADTPTPAPAPAAPPEAADAYTIVALVEGAPADWDACRAQLPTFGATEFAVAGLLAFGDQDVLAAGAIAQRLGMPLATITAALARLEAATIASQNPGQWDPAVLD